MDYGRGSEEMKDNAFKKKLEAEVSNVVSNMIELVYEEKTPPAVKVKIYEIIFDRVFGKPEETIHLDETMNNTEDAERMIAAFAERIRKKGEASDAGETNLQ